MHDFLMSETALQELQGLIAEVRQKNETANARRDDWLTVEATFREATVAAQNAGERLQEFMNDLVGLHE